MLTRLKLSSLLLIVLFLRLLTVLSPLSQMCAQNFNKAMHLNTNIQSLICLCFFQLRNVVKLRSIVSHAELEMTVHATVTHFLLAIANHPLTVCK